MSYKPTAVAYLVLFHIALGYIVWLKTASVILVIASFAAYPVIAFVLHTAFVFPLQELADKLRNGRG